MITSIVTISVVVLTLGVVSFGLYQLWKAYRMKVELVKGMWKFDPIRHMPKDALQEENEE